MTWWSKLFYLCPEEICEELFFFFTKTSKFSVVFRLWGKRFGFSVKVIWLGCQNCFQVSRGYFWKSCFLKIVLFWTSGTIFPDFWRNFCDRFVKTAFYVSSGDFWLDCFSTKIYEFFDRLRAVRKIFWHFGAKPSKSLSKLQYMCTKNFCGKFDLWKNFYIFFEYWSKILRLLTKMLSIRKNLSKIFFLGKNSCFSHGSWEGRFSVFGKNFRQVR